MRQVFSVCWIVMEKQLVIFLFVLMERLKVFSIGKIESNYERFSKSKIGKYLYNCSILLLRKKRLFEQTGVVCMHLRIHFVTNSCSGNSTKRPRNALLFMG